MGRSGRGCERQDSVSSILGTEIIHVAVGAEQREFAIHRKLLETSSKYFTELIAISMPLQLQPDLFCPWKGFSAAPSVRPPFDSEAYAVWLADESPTTFELFVLWLYQRSAGLTKIVDEATASGTVGSRSGAAGGKVIGNKCKALNLHWNLARLHVFAAKVGIDELQDLALDCLQDVFARCDWSVTPKFVRFVYERCDPDQAFRLRKWTVAMLAWTLATKGVVLQSVCPGMAECESARDGTPESPSTSESCRRSKSPRHQQQQQQSIPPIARRFSVLLVDVPDLLGDFSDHVSKLSKLRGSASLKNPSIRLPSNFLKSEERQYGFRMCSFHSHRRDVGQGTCPHRLSIASRTPAPSTMLFRSYNFSGGGAGVSAATHGAASKGSTENGRSRSRSGNRRTKSRGSGSDTSTSSS